VADAVHLHGLVKHLASDRTSPDRNREKDAVHVHAPYSVDLDWAVIFQQRSMAEAWTAGPATRFSAPRSTLSQETALDVGRLLLKTVLSDPYVDVALVGMREPRFVELNNEISDDVAARIDLAALHDRYVR
jgi:hypothetical protein